MEIENFKNLKIQKELEFENKTELAKLKKDYESFKSDIQILVSDAIFTLEEFKRKRNLEKLKNEK